MKQKEKTKISMLYRFEVEGQTVGSHTVIEALSMQLMGERAGRFEEVGLKFCDTLPPGQRTSCSNDFLARNSIIGVHAQVAKDRCYSIMLIEGERAEC